MYRFHRRLASFARVIRLDQRGIGMSSRVPSLDVIGPKFWAKDADLGAGRDRMRAGDRFRSLLCLDDRTRSRGRLSRASQQPGDLQRSGSYPACARLSDRVRNRRGRSLYDRGDGAGRRRPGRRHARCHRAQRGRRRRIPRVVGHGGQPRRLPQHGPRGHPRSCATPMCAKPSRGSPRRRWSCIATTRTSPRSPTAVILPSTSAARASSSCRAATPCTGSATPHRCSTRSRSSSPACGAGSAPSEC